MRSFRRFRRIALPLCRAFRRWCNHLHLGVTELGVPLMFDYTRVTSVEDFTEIKEIR